MITNLMTCFSLFVLRFYGPVNSSGHAELGQFTSPGLFFNFFLIWVLWPFQEYVKNMSLILS